MDDDYYNDIDYFIDFDIILYKNNEIIGIITRAIANKLLIEKNIEKRIGTRRSANLLKELSEDININKCILNVPENKKVIKTYYNEQFICYNSINYARMAVKRGYGKLSKEYDLILTSLGPENICDKNIIMDECNVCKSNNNLHKVHMIHRWINKNFKNVFNDEYNDLLKITDCYKIQDSGIKLCEKCYEKYNIFLANYNKELKYKFPPSKRTTNEYYINIIKKIKDDEGIIIYLKNYFNKFIDFVKPRFLPRIVEKILKM
jgi:hypothetical protein